MKEVQQLVQEHFINAMCSTGKLFRTAISGKEIWKIYLESFTDEFNPIFRDPQSSSHNCNLCHNFFNRYSNIVAIGENGIITIFDVAVPEEYVASFKAAGDALRASVIENVFFETVNELNLLPYEADVKKGQEFYQLGVANNLKKYTAEEAKQYGVVKAGELREFNHLWLSLPGQFVKNSSKSTAAMLGEYRTNYDVFKRGMQEISIDTLELVRDLINQGSLLDGTTHLNSIKDAIKYKKEYEKASNKENWLWNTIYTIDERTAKFRNTLLGVLCVELTEGEELNKACQNWNKRVDPANYMKATAPITKKQIEEAKKFVEEKGYEASFNRRLATIDDIKVDEIKFIDSGNGSVVKGSIFDGVKSTSTQHKRAKFENVEEISIEKFMQDIVPNCESIEVLFDNKHQNNLAVFTTAAQDSKPIFKWDNNYSWTFNGNLAGKSQIKEAVKTAGGAVDGVLRFSMMWAEKDGDNSDLDAHCKESKGDHIYFSHKTSYKTGGKLDIDITQPSSQMPNGAVENITYPSLSKMVDGDYVFQVHQFSERSSKGFKAEIEFNGQTYSYEYNKAVKNKNTISVATVTLKNGEFTIKHHLPESTSSKEVWGIPTQEFHKVNLVCLSPNYWGENQVGNKHYFFMIDGCKAPNAMRGFHNENLTQDLLTHRKVLEVLANSAMIEPKGKHLAGLGFNSTVKDEVIVRCKGSFNRMLKVKF